MATSKSRKPICDLHSNEEATVLCLKHHQFMCLDCVLEQKHKLHDCIQKGIEKLLPSEKYQYELILFGRGLAEKKLAAAEHMKQVGKKQEELKDTVEKHFQELVKTLQLKKDESLKDLEEQAKILHDRDMFEVKQIDELELQVKTNIEKLDDISHGSYDEELQELRRKEETLIREICPSAVRGNFSPCVMFDNNKKGLGEIEFFDMDATVSSSDDYLGPNLFQYKIVAAVVAESFQSSAVTGSEHKTGIDNKSMTQPPPVIGPKPNTIAKNPGGSNNEGTNVLSTDATKEQPLFPALPSRGKSKLGTIPKDLQDIPKPDFVKLKDKTVKLESGKKVSIPKAVSFTEVVITDSHNIILLDEKGKILLMVDFSGHVKCSKDVSGTVKIVGMQDGCIGISNGNEIKIYCMSSCGFTPSKKKIAGLKNEIEHITGFDYCFQTEQFAVSGLNKNDEMKLMVVKDSDQKDAKDSGQKVAKLLYKQTKPYKFNMIRTIYCFDAKKLFCMNIGNKSLKCVDCETEKRDWALICTDSDFCPREMTLRENLIFVTSPSFIFIFSQNDGETKKKVPTETLLKDIHGISFIEGEHPAIVTSTSDDRDTSLTLGFVSI